MNEQISALTDDEVAAEDVANIIAMMQTNNPAAAAWSQYHLIGDMMRDAAITGLTEDGYGTGLSHHFKQNLMQRLELEPTVLSPNVALSHYPQDMLLVEQQVHRKIPVVWSIAASFAAVMVVGWMALHLQTQSGQELAPIEVAQQSVPAEYLVAHQASAPSASSYYIQSVSYSE